MNVLKAGKPKPKIAGKLKCPHCGCKMEYNQLDVRADDQPGAMPFVLCPQVGCRERVYIMDEKNKLR